MHTHSWFQFSFIERRFSTDFNARISFNKAVPYFCYFLAKRFSTFVDFQMENSIKLNERWNEEMMKVIYFESLYFFSLSLSSIFMDDLHVNNILHFLFRLSLAFLNHLFSNQETNTAKTDSKLTLSV